MNATSTYVIQISEFTFTTSQKHTENLLIYEIKERNSGKLSEIPQTTELRAKESASLVGVLVLPSFFILLISQYKEWIHSYSGLFRLHSRPSWKIILSQLSLIRHYKCLMLKKRRKIPGAEVWNWNFQNESQSLGRAGHGTLYNHHC